MVGDGPIVGTLAVEIGNWRISARVDWVKNPTNFDHLSVGHKDGNVARIYRSDKTIHKNVQSWNDWTNFPDIGEPQCAFMSSKGFLQIGNWRIADLGVGTSDDYHLSVGHKHGGVSSIYRSDGYNSAGPGDGWNPWLAKWNLEGGTVVAGRSDSGCPA